MIILSVIRPFACEMSVPNVLGSKILFVGKPIACEMGVFKIL